MKALLQALKAHVDGEIHFDPIHRKVYSVDASIYEVEPMGVVIPRTTEALLTTVKIAQEFKVPIIPRGAATGITGSCLSTGLIIDTSKYLNRIKEINTEKQYVVCEPGVVQDHLNAALAKYGYRLGPDTSTGDRATLGGMLANNSAGAHSLIYGTMADHLLEVELLLVDGTSRRFKEIDEQEWSVLAQQDELYKTLWHIREQYADDIRKQFPTIPRRVSGYNLDAFLKSDTFNPCRLIAGSEGSLGIATEIKMKIVPILHVAGICLIFLDDILKGMQAIEKMLQYQPCALEMIDEKIIYMGRSSPSMLGKISWLTGNPQALFIAEFQLAEDLNRFHKAMQSAGYSCIVMRDAKQIENVWELRKSGLGLLLSKRSYSRAIAFIEDLSVAPQKLHSFMKKLSEYFKDKGETAGIYGHIGSGCMHIRPYIDLRKKSDVARMQQMMLDVADLVHEYGGALSGEHGDGLIRSWLNEKMFGKRIYQAFLELKNAFDPENRMNPGKVVNGPPLQQNLRLDPSTPIVEIPTFLNFEKEGGLALAADLCNGNGLCRKSKNLMCPSFQATQDEFHTTRARAQALRSVIHGRLPAKDFTSQGMHDVLDLCLECKGCKTECPSEVDMAKMKSEFLYHYHKAHGISWRSYFFSRLGLFSKLGALSPSLINKLSSLSFAKKLLGVSEKRNLPPLALGRFSKRQRKQAKHEKQIVLFLDTFTEFYCPEVGEAALSVFEALGYEVIIPSWSCCGRPALSKGELPYSKKLAERVVKTLLPYAELGLPIIGLEPSCLLTIKEDYTGLLGHDNPHVKPVAERCILFDEWLLQQHLPFEFKDLGRIKVHTHCHQKAGKNKKATLEFLQKCQRQVEEIPSGCCGMAGSFGYETEHFEISMKIGNLHLFPALQDSPTIIANGFSCRNQISHGTHQQALHLSEFVKLLFQNFTCL